MIRPRAKLIAWAGAAGIPLATLATAVPTVAPAAFALLALIAAVAGLDLARAARYARGVSVAVAPLVRLTLGRSAPLAVQVTPGAAGGRTLRLALGLPFGLTSDRPERSIELPESGRAELEWTIDSTQRGRFALRRCRTECASPWGFWAVRQDAPISSRVQVYPDLVRERRVVSSLFLRRGGSGVHAERQIGRGREFEKLREYLPGDSQVDVSWKASAKRGHLVTKEFQIEQTQEVYAIVDHSRLSGRMHGDRSSLDRTLRAAMVLALAAARQRDLFGLLTFSDRVRGFLPARAGRHQYEACREMLYDRHTEFVSPDFVEVAGFVRRRLRRRALLVFFTDLLDPAISEDFARAATLLGRHHLVLACTIRPVGVAPIFSQPAASERQVVEHLAGDLLWTRLQQLSRQLARRGVDLAVLERATLASDVVRRYLSVKRRQRL